VFSDNRTPEERANDAAQAQEAEDQQNGTAPIVPATVPKPAFVGPPAPAATTAPAPAATPAQPAAHNARPAKPAVAKPPATAPSTAPTTTRQREQ